MERPSLSHKPARESEINCGNEDGLTSRAHRHSQTLFNVRKTSLKKPFYRPGKDGGNNSFQKVDSPLKQPTSLSGLIRGLYPFIRT